MLTERFQGCPDIPALIQVLMSPDINLAEVAQSLQEHFLQYLFDAIENDVLERLQYDIDDNVIEIISSSLKDGCLKKRVEMCKGLENQTKILCLSSLWSSFDYDIIKILIKKCVPLLTDKIKNYKMRFKDCTIEAFANCFKVDTFEKINSEKVLIVKLKLVSKKMKYIKKDLCKNLREVLNIDILRLQKLQKVEDFYMLTFLASFQEPELSLNKLKGKQIAKLEKCITEVKLESICLFGLSDKIWALEKLVDGSASSIPLVVHNTDFTGIKAQFIFNPEAIQLIDNIKAKHIGIISICGPYRGGKSFFLSKLLGESNAFEAKCSHSACTRGIWISTTVLRCNDFVLLLMDTEGTDAPEEGAEQCTNHLLTLTTLLSSYMIYNTKEIPKKSELSKLQFVTTLSATLHEQKKSGSKDTDISKYFPDFLWLVRDADADVKAEILREYKTLSEFLKNCILQSSGTGRDIISKVFPSISCKMLPHPDTDPSVTYIPKFDSAVLTVCEEIRNSVKHKAIFSPFKSTVFVSILKKYLKAINAAKLPNIENAFIEAALSYLKDEADKMVKEYENRMASEVIKLMPLEDSEQSSRLTLLKIHNEIFNPIFEVLKCEVQKYSTCHQLQAEDLLCTFKSKVEVRFQQFRKQNYEASRKFCEGIVQTLQNPNIETIRRTFLAEAKGPAKDIVLKEYIATIPGPPNNFRVYSVQHDSITLKWEKPSTNSEIVNTYSICCHFENSDDKNPVSPVLTVQKEELSAKVSPLLPYRDYKFSVCAVTDTKQRGEEVYVSESTPAGKPLKPPKPTILYEDFSLNHVRVKMQIPKSYDPIHCGKPIKDAIYRVTSQFKEVGRAVASISDKEGFIITVIEMKDDRSDSEKYFIQVQLRNAEGCSEWSEKSTLEVMHLIPGPPHQPVYKAKSKKIIVSWKKPSIFPSSLHQFCATLKTKEASSSTGITIKTSKNTVTFDNLTPFTAYHISLWAENIHGKQSRILDLYPMTSLVVPEAPKKPRVEFVSNYNCVEISFAIPECYESNPSEVEVVIADQQVPLLDDILNCKHVVLKDIDLDKYNLTEGNMACKVRVSNSKGPSEWSEPFDISVTSLTPLQPSHIEFSNAVSKELKIQWKPPITLQSIVDHYEIRLRSIDNSRQQVFETEKKESSFVIKDLRPNTEYNCDVYSVSKTEKKRRNSIPVKTKTIPPDKPDSPVVKIIDSDDEIYHHVTATIKFPTLEKSNWSEITELELVTSSDLKRFSKHEKLTTPRLKDSCEFDITLDHIGCQSYKFTVRFRNEGGWSQYSDETTNATIYVRQLFAGQPQAAQGICRSREIDVTWSEPKKNPESVDHYLIAINGKGVEEWKDVRVGRTMRLARFQDLVPNSDYAITIKAVTSKTYDNTPTTTLNVRTGLDAPNKPNIQYLQWEVSDGLKNTVKITVPKPKEEDCNGSPVKAISVSVKAFFTSSKSPVTFDDDNIIKKFSVKWLNEKFEQLSLDLPNIQFVSKVEIGTELMFETKLAYNNDIGWSDDSDSITFSGKKLIPGQPENVEVVGISESKFKLSWDHPAVNPYSVKSYKLSIVEFQNKDSVHKPEEELPGKASGIIIYNVNSKTKFCIQLCARSYELVVSDVSVTATITKRSVAERIALTASTAVLGSLAAPITTAALMVEKVKELYQDHETGKAVALALVTPLAATASIAVPPASGIAAAFNVHQHLCPKGDLESTDWEYDFIAEKLTCINL